MPLASFSQGPSAESQPLSSLTLPPVAVEVLFLMSHKTLFVPKVDAYLGQIACDGGTKSETVCLLFLRR
jgi:hypothetical protein